MFSSHELLFWILIDAIDFTNFFSQFHIFKILAMSTFGLNKKGVLPISTFVMTVATCLIWPNLMVEWFSLHLCGVIYFFFFYKLWKNILQFWDYLLSSLLPSTNFSSNIWLLFWPLIIYVEKNVFKILSVFYKKLCNRGIDQFHEIFYSKSFQNYFQVVAESTWIGWMVWPDVEENVT